MISLSRSFPGIYSEQGTVLEDATASGSRDSEQQGRVTDRPTTEQGCVCQTEGQSHSKDTGGFRNGPGRMRAILTHSTKNSLTSKLAPLQITKKESNRAGVG